MSKQRLLIGAINREVLFAQRIMRIFDMNFSMVRRSAAWASRESKSASLITTTGRTRLHRHRGTPTVAKLNGRTFEPLLGIQIHLLRLRNLLQQILNHDPIVISDVTRG
jgi:hypothetical protein